MARPQKADKIAADLLKIIRKNSINALPAASRLAEHFGVSKGTVAKALKILESEGAVERKRGRRAHCEMRKHSIPAQLSSAELLYVGLRKRIITGSFKVGHQLPKISYMVSSAGVSAHTVIEAYHMLVARNLAHKKGRIWIAGPRPDCFTDSSILNPPVILLLQNKENSWRSLSSSSRTADFCRTFTSETEERGVRIIPVFASALASPGNVFASGQHEVIRLAKKLETRYLGTLIAGGMQEIEGFCDWARALMQLGKPVVWFDRYNELFHEDLNAELFTRCHFSEENAVTEVIEHLYERGHRTIGYANIYQDGWRINRARLLQDAAQRYGPDMKVIIPKTFDNWSQSGPEITRRILDELFGCELAPIRKLLEFFGSYRSGSAVIARSDAEIRSKILTFLSTVSQTPDSELSDFHQHARIILFAPLLAELLREPKITALITPHDWDARHLYYTLETAGLSVPGVLSLISFDNSLLVHPLPVTTADFGFGYLGYCAFHVLYGDIKIDRDQKGNIPSHPHIVNRGSVAPVRRH